MIILSGPNYRYAGERLDRPTIIVIQDHHYDPDSGYALRQLLDASVCDKHSHLLVFDHVLRQDEFNDYDCVCLPLLMAAECREFQQQAIPTHWQAREHAFNFMINKPRPHRRILMDTILELGLTNYRHSLCWSNGYGGIPGTDFRFGDELCLEQGMLNGQHTNASTYRYLLKGSVFECTAVSLITEPVFYERETIITEKTVMAMWAGTLPIWVGGWHCADVMREFGFDVFDDVIDHSYQSLADPHDRCRQAIVRNLPLLEQVTDLSPLHSRLQHNLDLMRDNIWLQKINHIVRGHPHLETLVTQFRHGLLGSC